MWQWTLGTEEKEERQEKGNDKQKGGEKGSWTEKEKDRWSRTSETFKTGVCNRGSVDPLSFYPFILWFTLKFISSKNKGHATLPSANTGKFSIFQVQKTMSHKKAIKTDII